MILCDELLHKTEENLRCDFQNDLQHANAMQLHNALSNAVMAMVSGDWIRSRQKRMEKRRAYYLSAEYLIGRMVYNNLYCLGILDEVKQLMLEKNVDIAVMEDIEDAAFGSGGLGRLAACFLDSAATHGIPLDGYGLRYRYGLFKQTFNDGEQCETADDWQRWGDPWSRRRDDQTVIVEFAEQKVLAVPYDMPIFGYKTDNIASLRLWQSEPICELDFNLFNEQKYDLALHEKNEAENITRVLYPNDNTDAGKRLRLKQQHFLASASLQDIICRYKKYYGNNFSSFACHCAIQLNDTHPTISIPELIRLLMIEGLTFENAFETAQNTFSYTNHTVISEAFEKWGIELFNTVVPQIGGIILKIDAKLKAVLKGKLSNNEIEHMRIIDQDGFIHMANLAVYVSSYVNGVAKIHTEILKSDIFSSWYKLWPHKFQSITNGITQRRWLGLCNPELSTMISERIGDGFLTDLSQLQRLKEYIDKDMISSFNKIKRCKKEQLSAIIKERENIAIYPEYLFDVQIKRMHEYKRQLLNAFSILDIYFGLKDGTLKDFYPTVFIFGAKAAPGYSRAKAIIRYINEIAKIINTDPSMKELMQIVFVRNYDCTYAEHIIPAADISEQISPAGTEASGTGNMKLILNGAVTLGTYDGANIEIAEQAGEENNYIFGARIEDINRIKTSYDPSAIYESNARIRRVVDTLIDGTLSASNTVMFKELHNALLKGTSWHKPDHFYLLLDMMSYFETKERANANYRDRMLFGRKCLFNIASAGVFSSDRTIIEYAKKVWHLL